MYSKPAWILPFWKLIWLFAFFGVVVLGGVAFFGGALARPDGPLGPFHLTSIWQVWDLAAAFWSFTFFVYYFIEFEPTGYVPIDKLFYVVLIPCSIFIPPAIVFFLCVWHSTLTAIILTFSLNVVYFAIDGLMSRIHPSRVGRCSYKEAFFLADVPIVLANLCFLIWLAFHREPAWETFASGLIGFQMLSCNIIFVITQAGLVRSIWENHLTEMQPHATPQASTAAAPGVVTDAGPSGEPIRT